MQYVNLTLAGYSDTLAAMKGKVTKAGLRAMVIADQHKFTHATDWKMESVFPGGTYCTLAELARQFGSVGVQTRSFRGDVIAFEYDGRKVTFR